MKHGMYKSAEYQSWAKAKERCYNQHHIAFYRYGGRGITMCREWRDSFCAFVAYMGQRPSLSHSLDRIDNSKGYYPGNVRWATREEQSRNTETNRIIELNGERRTLIEWAEVTGMSRRTIGSRLDRGWPISRALTERPAGRKKRIGRFGVGI